MPEGEGFNPERDGEPERLGLSEADLRDLNLMNDDAAAEAYRQEKPHERAGHIYRAQRDAEDAAALENPDFDISDMFPEGDEGGAPEQAEKE